MKIIALADCAPQPWKNGGGTTRELLTWPDAAHWRLRLSVADITQDGPFSAFPGVARAFVVLQGAGVVLHFAGRDVQQTRSSPPLEFDGGDAPGCTLVAGATRDLNLMRRGVDGSGLVPASAQVWVSARAARGVFTREAAMLDANGQTHAVPAMGLALSLDAAQQSWRLDTPGAAWWFDWDSADTRQPHD